MGFKENLKKMFENFGHGRFSQEYLGICACGNCLAWLRLAKHVYISAAAQSVNYIFLKICLMLIVIRIYLY